MGLPLACGRLAALLLLTCALMAGCASADQMAASAELRLGKGPLAGRRLLHGRGGGGGGGHRPEPEGGQGLIPRFGCV